MTEAERLRAVRRYQILAPPPDGAFHRVCHLAARFFDVPVATVTIVDEDRIWLKACRGLDATQIPREPGLCASAILQDEPYLVSDALSDPRTAANSLVHGELGVRFYAAAPITTVDGHRLGTVNVIDTTPHTVGAEQMQVLSELAAIVMTQLDLQLAAISTVSDERALRREAVARTEQAEQLAATLQETLLPPELPRIDGLDIAAYHRPFAPEGVGGDFYDVFPLGGDRWAFFIGDVCGKGPAAARLTSLARYTLRTAATLEESPAAMLRTLNTALGVTTTDDLPVCTAVCGVIERDADGTIAIALSVAGHPSPLIVRAGGEVETITSHGPLLGAMPDPRLETVRATLRSGDGLVLYTDGILDLSHAGSVVTGEWIAGFLAGRRNARAADLLARLRAILDGVDPPPRDDVALLVLRADGVAGEHGRPPGSGRFRRRGRYSLYRPS